MNVLVHCYINVYVDILTVLYVPPQNKSDPASHWHTTSRVHFLKMRKIQWFFVLAQSPKGIQYCP